MTLHFLHSLRPFFVTIASLFFILFVMSTRSLSFVIFSFVFFCGVVSAQPILHSDTHLKEPADAPREHNFSQQLMSVSVSFDPPKGIVYGKVSHHIMALGD